MNTYISSTLLLTSVLRVRLVPNPYMNESCHTYEWVMSHMHVHTHTLRTSLLNWNSSRKKFKYTHAHIQTHIRHYMCMDIYIYSSRTLSLTGVVGLRLVPNPYKNETCHKHEWVMSHMHIYSYPSKTLSLTGVLRWRLVPHPTSPALSAVPLPGVYVREYVCVHVYILRKDVNMRISLRLRLVPYSTLLVLSDVPRTGVYVRKYLYLWADKYYVWIYICVSTCQDWCPILVVQLCWPSRHLACMQQSVYVCMYVRAFRCQDWYSIQFRYYCQPTCYQVWMHM